MKRILFVLQRDDHFRNYISTSAFSELEDFYECFFIGASSGDIGLISGIKELEKKENFLGFYPIDKKSKKQYKNLSNILRWKYRKKSSSFRFFHNRIFLVVPRNVRYRKLKIIINQFKVLKIYLLGSEWIPKKIIDYLYKKIKINGVFFRIAKEVKPDLIIYPAKSSDPEVVYVQKTAQILGSKSLILTDNWDNPSSKNIYWKKPNYLTVWGEQSKEHAVTIQGMDKEHVYCIGTPRYDQYNGLAVSSPFAFPYILFCGVFLPFDEISALKLLDKEVSEKKSIYGDRKIVYRPHPGRIIRDCFDNFIESDYSNIILDPQIAENYKKKMNFLVKNQRKNFYAINRIDFPDLEYYPSLLKNADLVISGLTSMFIESLICGRRTLVIRYDDGFHYTSPHNCYKYFKHFEGIDDIKALSFCDKKEDLSDCLRFMVLEDKKYPIEEIRESLQYFIFNDNTPYPKRLKKVVKSIFRSDLEINETSNSV